MFGHENSFTGADRHHVGFRGASGGTLFLDEVTEMPAELQVALRVLRRHLLRSARRKRAKSTCGSSPSNKDPLKAVDAGTLRVTCSIGSTCSDRMPLLRERLTMSPDRVTLGDLERRRAPEIVYAGGMARLADYHRPGNVRELRNIVPRLPDGARR